MLIDWLTFDNHRQLHSTLGYVIPIQFVEKWLVGQARQAAQWAWPWGMENRGKVSRGESPTRIGNAAIAGKPTAATEN